MSIVVDILNDWWMEGRVPKELTRAEVVLIYKKRKHRGNLELQTDLAAEHNVQSIGGSAE